MTFFQKLLNDESGATAIEYGLIAALLAVAVMTTVAGLGSQLNTTFSRTSSRLQASNA
ncbi:Flp family type IVb pilin [Novosphingobium flavum]|uniref:Flp family type IVb pilin n=1 Tax=Novosphingobium aerophilum TaxID=2839843 RepID=A0A7X1F5F8_9SPHN|nr:Flp family type IVb pilin [Novosphingobium aerophilum]MBC2650742.1 Flp family type IVb pilin [Novosphingobium aerophilum]MBC2663376.1 Flp family type IVb pilin [Novosphingobium aerophilum]